MRIKDIVIIGMLSAILIAVQVALGFLPNIELVSFLILIYTLIYRQKAIYIVYVFVITELFIYGFGLWWINYLYVWAILFIIVMIFRNKRSAFFWAVVSCAFGLGFGALCSIPYFFMGGIAAGFAYWASGIPFDIIHGIANFVVAFVLYRPVYIILDKLNKRMNA